uniref:Uncharacterized protein n=1 Tax=Timema cristinae TaxID=61476 RepID=A0A7R9GRQ4_TIMCR|nr:unnamed protein product [Timema cristinae]
MSGRVVRWKGGKQYNERERRLKCNVARLATNNLDHGTIFHEFLRRVNGRSMLLLSSRLPLGHPNGLFPLGLLVNILNMVLDARIREACLDTRVIFNIVNFSKHKNLFREGMTPLVKSTSRPKWYYFSNHPPVYEKDTNIFVWNCVLHSASDVVFECCAHTHIGGTAR